MAQEHMHVHSGREVGEMKLLAPFAPSGLGDRRSCKRRCYLSLSRNSRYSLIALGSQSHPGQGRGEE